MLFSSFNHTLQPGFRTYTLAIQSTFLKFRNGRKLIPPMESSFVQAEQQRGTQISNEKGTQPAPRASSSCRAEEQARCAELSTHPSPSVARGKNYHERHGSSAGFKPGKWFSSASTWRWGGMDTASLVPLQSPQVPPPRPRTALPQRRFPAPCPARARPAGTALPVYPSRGGPAGSRRRRLTLLQ